MSAGKNKPAGGSRSGRSIKQQRSRRAGTSILTAPSAASTAFVLSDVAGIQSRALPRHTQSPPCCRERCRALR